MDSRIGEPLVNPPAPEKRKQKYLHFTLQPDDIELLALLSDEQRVLLQTDGTYEERAQKLGIPIGTVRSRLHRARVALEQLRESRATVGPVGETAPVSH